MREPQQFNFVGFGVASLELALGVDGEGWIDGLQGCPERGLFATLLGYPGEIKILGFIRRVGYRAACFERIGGQAIGPHDQQSIAKQLSPVEFAQQFTGFARQHG